MTDRELLEAAARAAGISAHYDEKWGGMLLPVTVMESDDGYAFWNSIQNPADALELAAKLRVDIEHNNPLDNSFYVRASRCGITMVQYPVSIIEEFDGDGERLDAMCRAITRAAAAIDAKEGDQ